jgi:PilZ domain
VESTSTLSSPIGLWAVATISGRPIRGELVGFSRRTAVVAFDRAQPVAAGQSIRLQIGIDNGLEPDETTVVARVLHVMLTRDGRPAIAFTLPDDEAQARRGEVRVPFDARIELVICDGRIGGDAHQRARAIDLSATGMSIDTDRELPPLTTVLLRLRLPRAQGPIQFRAQVRWCRPRGNRYVCGLHFTGIKPNQAREVAATIVELSGTNP